MQVRYASPRRFGSNDYPQCFLWTNTCYKKCIPRSHPSFTILNLGSSGYTCTLNGHVFLMVWACQQVSFKLGRSHRFLCVIHTLGSYMYTAEVHVGNELDIWEEQSCVVFVPQLCIVLEQDNVLPMPLVTGHQFRMPWLRTIFEQMLYERVR